jgi:hypothetical protein
MLDSHTPDEIVTLSKFPEENEHQLLSVLLFDFIPNGFFSRLITRTLSLFMNEEENSELGIFPGYSAGEKLSRSPREQKKIPGEDKRPFLWSDGLLLHFRNLQLFCRKYPNVNKVEIQVRGPRNEIPKVEEFSCQVFDTINGLLGRVSSFPFFPFPLPFPLILP